tara:strand:+ start:657 stop:797 length:141 start_codon:yes stop_codon:yes gene_type:complete
MPAQWPLLLIIDRNVSIVLPSLDMIFVRSLYGADRIVISSAVGSNV